MSQPSGPDHTRFLYDIGEHHLRWALKNVKLHRDLRKDIEEHLRRLDEARARHADPEPGHRAPAGERARMAAEALHRAADRTRVYRAEVQDALKTAYRELTLRYHPDRGGSHEAMIAINEMYDRLNTLIARLSK
jgi:tryptophan 2,3-dioxygenase